MLFEFPKKTTIDARTCGLAIAVALSGNADRVSSAAGSSSFLADLRPETHLRSRSPTNPILTFFNLVLFGVLRDLYSKRCSTENKGDR